MNFVTGSQDIKIGIFPEKQPYSSSSIAFVYTNRHEECIAVKNGERLSRAELRYGKFNKIYRVDITPKSMEYRNEFSSTETVETFDIKVSIVVQVDDPVIVWRNSGQDYKQFLNPQLFYAISEIAKNYNIHELKRVALAIEDLKTDHKFNHKLQNMGLSLVDVNANVELSVKTKAHLERMNDLQKNTEYEKVKSTAEDELNNDLKMRNTRFNNTLKVEEMEGIREIIEMYGMDGLRIALASTDKERAVIIQELQEKQHMQHKENSQLIKDLIDRGLSIDEIYKLYPQLKFNPSSSVLNPTLPSSKTEKIESRHQDHQKPDDKLISELEKVIDSIDS